MAQGYNDRLDESLGMRRGKESKMKQSYKARRDESRGMSDRYDMGMGVMGHEKKPMKCNAFEAQKYDMGRVQREPMDSRGYPKMAWDYKF
jgi:hypothetical protein